MLKLLAVIFVSLILLATPAISLGQGPPVCGFYGYATIDGEGVDDGTEIKAWIDNVMVGSVETYPLPIEGYTYNYALTTKDNKDHTGETVILTIGPNDLIGGSAEWGGGDNIHLDLDADADAPPATLSDPAITLYPSEGIATQISGEGFTPNSSISITVGGTPVGTVIANTNSTFSIVIAAPTQNAGTYTVRVTDTAGRSDQAVLTVPDMRGELGPTGDKGDRGAPGTSGEDGPRGPTGGIGLAIAALVLAVIAIGLAGLAAIRVSTYWRRR